MKSRPSITKGKRKDVRLEKEASSAGAGLEEGDVDELVLSEEEEIEAVTSAIEGLQEPLSPGASLKTIQRQDDIRKDFGFFLKRNEQCNSDIRQGKTPIPPVLHSGSVVRNLENSFKGDDLKPKVKITLEDIEDEVLFWKPSIVCYVLGANPPLQIMEGFAKRMWGDKLDRVKLLSFGIYIIRFSNVEARDQVLNGGFIFFNRRPVIMKPWKPNENFSKEDVSKVPIWIQLEGLELKYWGEKSLFKIVGQMGKPIMVDAITKERERLSYPRILIEVCMNQKLPEMLEFEDEHGWNSSIGVKYEWKPSICTHCSGLGHIADDCRKRTVGKTEWIVKADNRKNIQVDEEGFTKVVGSKKSEKVKEKRAETMRGENPLS
ncbi:hypothetical protein CsatA_004594 [Cannabis sativa]